MGDISKKNKFNVENEENEGQGASEEAVGSPRKQRPAGDSRPVQRVRSIAN